MTRPRPVPPGRRPNRQAETNTAPSGDAARWLYGSHAVNAALANEDRRPRRLLATADAAASLAPNPPIRPEIVERQVLDQTLPPGSVHQGLALLADSLPEYAAEDLIDRAGPTSLIVVLDQVTDPHNVGAIFRSAAVFGASGLIMTDRNAPPLTGTLAKAASGAIEQVPLARVVNLSRTLRTLQEAGFWCIGLDAEGEKTLEQATGPARLALVMGAEGDGLRRLTAETCDELARLPAAGNFTSLNVSNAAAVALYIARKSQGSSER
jgi:23S rRNA (guanosine2251-2'-O)-methyltransferase